MDPSRPPDECLRDQARARRRATVYAAYLEAAMDPEFLADMDDTTRAFDVALLDGLTEDE